MLDGITDAEDQWLREACILFLLDKHLTTLPGVELDDEQRLLAAQAQLPLLHLGELNWYQGFHEIILYPDDFKSPQRHRDDTGVEHAGCRTQRRSLAAGADHPGLGRGAGQWRLGGLQPGDP